MNKIIASHKTDRLYTVYLLYTDDGFQEFLKKEFSEENIEFWQTCEDYRNIADPSFVSLTCSNFKILLKRLLTI